MVTCRAAGLSALPEVRVGVPAAHRQVVERLSRHSMETTTARSQLAGRGDLDAQFRLGYRLMFCRDRQHRDLIKAFRLWKQAAEQGHVRARFYLATCYDFGQGTRKNVRLAMRWYQQAALAGHEVAQYNLAMGLRDGVGVRRNLRAAVRWFRSAARAGDPEAQSDLGWCLHEGAGVRKNLREAAEWYHRAAMGGVLRAQFNLGLCYRDGEGVTRNPTKARHWLRKAARRGHTAARELLKTRRRPTKVSQADDHLPRSPRSVARR